MNDTSSWRSLQTLGWWEKNKQGRKLENAKTLPAVENMKVRIVAIVSGSLGNVPKKQEWSRIALEIWVRIETPNNGDNNLTLSANMLIKMSPFFWNRRWYVHLPFFIGIQTMVSAQTGISLRKWYSRSTGILRKKYVSLTKDKKTKILW